MPMAWLREWYGRHAVEQRLARRRCETALRLLETVGPRQIAEDADAAAWKLLGGWSKEPDDQDRQCARDQARRLVDENPYARNAMTLYRNYVIGVGMKQRVKAKPQCGAELAEGLRPSRVAFIQSLWEEFLEANDWEAGNRKDWEFCQRTWRDGECFLRLFRQPTWPPRVHFVDPEQVAADPQTGLPTHGIATTPGNVEEPISYRVAGDAQSVEIVEGGLMLHTKIGVDGNVKRGASLFLPVIDTLKRFQSWLDVELIQRKVASSIVLVRKHHQNYPGGLAGFADEAACTPGAYASGLANGASGLASRKLKLQPGTIIDAQGFDLQFLSPNTHFDDASLLGRMLLLTISAGLGLPEFMLASDASNANYSSTLVAEAPAVRCFATWQSFFIGQWRKLFAMVSREAVRLGLLTAAEARQVELELTPQPLAVRNRLEEAQASAIYFDRGALSRQELARRDFADPEQMDCERGDVPVATRPERGDQ